MIKRCDGHTDCFNNFDEINCTLVIIDKHLNRKESPPLGDEKDINVQANITLLSIGSIDELKQTFVAKFIIVIQW